MAVMGVGLPLVDPVARWFWFAISGLYSECILASGLRRTIPSLRCQSRNVLFGLRRDGRPP